MKILGRNLFAQGKWIALENIDYIDNHGTHRVWEAVSRNGTGGAVMLIVRLHPSNRLLLVRQFRPPVASCVIEFPAGLIDPGESPEASAVRELREETGYTGTIERIFPKTITSPGLTGEFLYTVLMNVDENAQGEIKTDFQDGEDIETFCVKESELLGFIEKEMASGTQIDSKVLTYSLNR